MGPARPARAIPRVRRTDLSVGTYMTASSITGRTSRLSGGRRTTSSGVATTSTAAISGRVTAGGPSSPGGDARSASGRSSQGRAHCLGLTLEAIDSLLAAGKSTAMPLEFAHAHSRERRNGVVLGFVMMDLVDRNGRVDDRRLDDLLLKDGLDGLMD